MAERIILSDGSGRWFDAAKAQMWEGPEGEVLYQSVCLLWVLRRAGPATEGGAVVEIDDQEAIAWLKRNGHPLPSELLSEVLGGQA